VIVGLPGWLIDSLVICLSARVQWEWATGLADGCVRLDAPQDVFRDFGAPLRVPRKRGRVGVGAGLILCCSKSRP
jgi:hypothetical protein